MSDEQGYGLHPLAAEDITDIWEYIAKGDLLAARRVREELLKAIRLLVRFPHMGYKRPKLTSKPLRFKLAREYVIAYAPEKTPLWVVAVFHGRRNPRVIADMLRGRE
jgi:plasmid stabilization system protein ParE